MGFPKLWTDDQRQAAADRLVMLKKFDIHAAADVVLRLLEQGEITRSKARESLRAIAFNQYAPELPLAKLNWSDDAPSAPPEQPKGEAECTGVAATWCPRCGDCKCPKHPDGALFPRSAGDCPLHNERSAHAEPPTLLDEPPAQDATERAALLDTPVDSYEAAARVGRGLAKMDAQAATEAKTPPPGWKPTPPLCRGCPHCWPFRVDSPAQNARRKPKAPSAPTIAARLDEAVGLLREWQEPADPRGDAHERWKTDWLGRMEAFLARLDAEKAREGT